MMSYFLYCILKVIVLIMFMILVNFVVSIGGSLANTYSLGRSIKEQFNFSEILNPLNIFLKLINKTQNKVQYKSIFISIILLFVSILPMTVIPLNIGKNPEGYLGVSYSASSLLFAGLFILAYYTIKIVVMFLYPNPVAQLDGAYKIRKYLSNIIVYSLIFTLVHLVTGSNKIENIINLMTFDLKLLLLPAIIVYFSMLVSQSKNDLSFKTIKNLSLIDRGKYSLVSPTLILSDRLFFLSNMTLFLSIFFGRFYDLELHTYALFLIAIIWYLLKVLLTSFAVNYFQGFRINQSRLSIIDMDLDLKITLLLINLFLVMVWGK